jgi:hypothetical protein
MTVPAEPILIGGHSVFLKFFAMPRNPGDPRRIEGTMTLVGPEGVLTLDALVGPQGIPGEPSPIIRPEWGSPIVDAGDLPSLATLDESDDGRAWYIDGEWHVYAHQAGEFVIIQGSIPGPTGATPDISITAESIEVDTGEFTYGPITVTETGTSVAPNFHIEIPALPGPEGPASAIELASDYDDTIPSEPGDFLVKGPDDLWMPGQPTYFIPRKYTIPHNQFIATSPANPGTRFLIATLEIEPQDTDWYPDVFGHMRLQRGLLSSAQVEIEVRIGPSGTAGTGEDSPLCGLGPYDPSVALLDSVTICHVMPHFSDTGNPDRSITPDSEEGRCEAGTAYTIFVFTHRIGGSGNYSFTKTNAQLRVDVIPVVGSYGS